MNYVDSMVIPVAIKNLGVYTAMAEQSGALWREHGALAYEESVADDVKPGTLTSFPQSVMMKDDETVVCAHIEYESREHRDIVMAKVMADPRMKSMMESAGMPFDGKRMFFGGFKTIVDL